MISDAFLTCVNTEAAALRAGALFPATAQEQDTLGPPVTTVRSNSARLSWSLPLIQPTLSYLSPQKPPAVLVL